MVATDYTSTFTPSTGSKAVNPAVHNDLNAGVRFLHTRTVGDNNTPTVRVCKNVHQRTVMHYISCPVLARISVANEQHGLLNPHHNAPLELGLVSLLGCSSSPAVSDSSFPPYSGSLTAPPVQLLGPAPCAETSRRDLLERPYGGMGAV